MSSAPSESPRAPTAARSITLRELAHVARPRVRHQPLRRLGREALVGRRRSFEEMLGEGEDVGQPLAQRRQLNAQHVRADKQVVAEACRRARPASRSRWVAATTRTSALTGSLAPTGVTSRSCSTRSSLACTRAASRRSRRGTACRRRPARSGPCARRRRPVNAPFTWPKSSLSSSSSGIAAQLTATNGPRRARAVRDGARARRPPCRCRSRR